MLVVLSLIHCYIIPFCFLCRHGSGPYYVQFSVRLSSTDDNATTLPSFVVEVASVQDLPHTVFRFLDMVEYGLLDQSTAMIHPTKRNPPRFLLDSQPEYRKERKDKMRTLGFGKTALTFVEEASSKSSIIQPSCNEHSIGFVGKGPSLQLFLAPEDEESTVCFGSVVRGADLLTEMKAASARGEQAHIVEVKHLIV